MGKHFYIAVGISLVSYILTQGVCFHDESIASPAFYLTYSFLILVTALLFFSTMTFDQKHSRAFIPIWYSVNFVCFFLVLSLGDYGNIWFETDFVLAFWLSILILLVSTTAFFLNTIFMETTATVYTTLLLLGVSTTTPLWLAPLALDLIRLREVNKMPLLVKFEQLMKYAQQQLSLTKTLDYWRAPVSSQAGSLPIYNLPCQYS
jgi:hypothetical protein